MAKGPTKSAAIAQQQAPVPIPPKGTNGAAKMIKTMKTASAVASVPNANPQSAVIKGRVNQVVPVQKMPICACGQPVGRSKK